MHAQEQDGFSMAQSYPPGTTMRTNEILCSVVTNVKSPLELSVSCILTREKTLFVSWSDFRLKNGDRTSDEILGMYWDSVSRIGLRGFFHHCQGFPADMNGVLYCGVPQSMV